MTSDRKPSGTWAPLPPPRQPAWENAVRDKDLSNPTPYTPKGTFAIGEIIQHKKFGVGVVMGVKEGGKIIVVFETATRILAHGLK
jgi:hypothetical protein